MFCMNCGTQLPSGASLCWKCGNPTAAINNSITQSNNIKAEQVMDITSSTAKVEIYLLVNVWGSPGTFWGTNWEEQAAYELYIEITEIPSRGEMTYHLGEGVLILSKKQALTEGEVLIYKAEKKEIISIRSKVAEFLRPLNDAGWALTKLIYDVLYWEDIADLELDQFGDLEPGKHRHGIFGPIIIERR